MKKRALGPLFLFWAWSFGANLSFNADSVSRKENEYQFNYFPTTFREDCLPIW